MMLEEIRRKLAAKRKIIERLAELAKLPTMSNSGIGTTIGLKVPDDVRDRVMRLVESEGGKTTGLSSYSHAIATLLRLGLERAEEAIEPRP